MSKPFIKTDIFSDMATLDVGSIEKSYKGLAIHALQGLHEHLEELIKKHFPQSSKILDIAAGSGALCLRLQDMNHKVAACDYVSDNFRLKDTIEFYQVDLNMDFSKVIQNTFEGVLAVEIMEHLENPRHFIREIFALLEPGGTLILTTPNIDNPVSIALFARLGQFQWFADENYQNEGHITSVNQWELNNILIEAGFESIRIDSFGNPFRVLKGWPKMKILAKILKLINLSNSRAQGEILTVVARKKRQL